MIRSAGILWLLIAIPGPLPAFGQDQQDTAAPFVRLVMQDRPSLRVGSFLRVDFRAKAHLDLQRLSPQFETEAGPFDLNRTRFGVEGTLLEHLEYEVEREFRETFGGRESQHPWRDAYLNISYFDDFQLKVGKFKIPFSMEQLTGVSNLEFINRSRLADDLAPARDVGAVLHGRFFDRGVGYEAGVFYKDGENSESNVNRRGGRTLVLRMTAVPLRLLSLPGDWDEVEFGAAVATTEIPEGLSSLRGRTVAGEVFFPHVYVKGKRLRIGAEANWRPGPFSLLGEFVHVNESREEQSVRADNFTAENLDWLVSDRYLGHYRRVRENGIEPRRPFPSEGPGAIELAARYEEISFRSPESSGLQFSSPRAPNLLGNSDRVWTLGVNWYWNRYVKVQVNGIRETIEDVQRSPIEGRERFWMGMVRLQFSM